MINRFHSVLGLTARIHTISHTLIFDTRVHTDILKERKSEQNDLQEQVASSINRAWRARGLEGDGVANPRRRR